MGTKHRVAALWLAVVGLAACGLSPPQNVQLRTGEVDLVLPGSADCLGRTSLHEQRGLTLTVPAVTPGKFSLGYAVGCAREDGPGELFRNGPFMAWYSDGRLAMRGSYRHGRAHGLWHVYHDNGKLSVRARMANGKLAALGEYFDRGGAPDSERNRSMAAKLGTAAAFKTALERFPKAPFRMSFLQRLARLEFAASGAYVSGRRPQRYRGRSQYFHLHAAPQKKCRKRTWKPSNYEHCRIFREQCKKIWIPRYGSMVPGHSCRVGKQFYANLRGLAVRRTKCSDGRQRRCKLVPGETSPFLQDSKHGRWIDFPQGGPVGPCEWGRYSRGVRVGLWLRWERCQMSGKSLRVSIGDNRSLGGLWWSVDGMQRALAVAEPPDTAFRYALGEAVEVDVQDLVARAEESKQRAQQVHVKSRIDACMKQPPVEYGSYRRSRSRSRSRSRRRGGRQLLPIRVAEIGKSIRLQDVKVIQRVGTCAGLFRDTSEQGQKAKQYLAKLCQKGNARACRESRWHGFGRRRPAGIFREPKRRLAFAKGLLVLCKKSDPLSRAACHRLDRHFDDLHQPLFARQEAQLDAVVSEAQRGSLQAQHEKAKERHRDALDWTLCNHGALTVCFAAGRRAHRNGQHRKANRYFARACKHGAKGLCSYESKKLAVQEAAAAKRKAATDAKYVMRCKTLSGGGFSCHRVRRGTAVPSSSKACRMCRAGWRRHCRRRRIVNPLCTKVVAKNCQSQCN